MQIAIKKSRFRLFFTSLLPGFVMAHFSHHLLTALPVPLLPLIRDEFALDYTRSGLVLSAFTVSYGLAQLPGGWLADRVGPRLMVTIGICGVALAGLMVGLSNTYTMMMVFLVLMGLAGGAYHPASPPLITASVEPNKQGQALGFHQIGGSASYFLAPLISIGIAAAWSWRGSFIGLAIPAFIFGILFYMLMAKRLAVKRLEKIARGGEPAHPAYPKRQLIAVMTVSAIAGSLTMSSISFITLYVVDRFGASKEVAAATLSIFYACGLWATPIGGHLSDRLGRIRILLVACLVLGPLVYLLNVVPYGIGLGVLLVVLGTAVHMRMPVVEAYIVTHTSESRRSMILGIYYFSGQEGNAILTPLLGFLIDRFGFNDTFTTVAVVLAVSALSGLVLLWRSRD